MNVREHSYSQTGNQPLFRPNESPPCLETVRETGPPAPINVAKTISPSQFPTRRTFPDYSRICIRSDKSDEWEGFPAIPIACNAASQTIMMIHGFLGKTMPKKKGKGEGPGC